MSEFSRTGKQRAATLAVVVLGMSGCVEDPVLYDLPECDDDMIGWVLELANVVELPGARFEVACASGWGHGVDTREPSELVELPNAYQSIFAHPQGGMLVLAYAYQGLWSDRLGADIASESLMWVDERGEVLHWQLEDQRYRMMAVVTGASADELWAWGEDASAEPSLSRIDLSTGELLERVDWPAGVPVGSAIAWPTQRGIWQVTEAGYDADSVQFDLRRMQDFGVLGEAVRSFDSPFITLDDGSVVVAVPRVSAIPDGGALWGLSEIESIAEDGSSRWMIDAPHSYRIVDDQGGFLLANVGDEDPNDHRTGLSLQRRQLDDGALLWERVHHRYEFVDTPELNEWLFDGSYSYAVRPGGGYLIAGGHAYPASSCPQQPIVWAIDIDGEVEWAHRLEVCGDAFLPSARVDARAMVLGFSSAYGDRSNAGTEARWAAYFDL